MSHGSQRKKMQAFALYAHTAHNCNEVAGVGIELSDFAQSCESGSCKTHSRKTRSGDCRIDDKQSAINYCNREGKFKTVKRKRSINPKQTFVKKYKGALKCTLQLFEYAEAKRKKSTNPKQTKQMIF